MSFTFIMCEKNSEQSTKRKHSVKNSHLSMTEKFDHLNRILNSIRTFVEGFDFKIDQKSYIRIPAQNKSISIVQLNNIFCFEKQIFSKPECSLLEYSWKIWKIWKNWKFQSHKLSVDIIESLQFRCSWN